MREKLVYPVAILLLISIVINIVVIREYLGQEERIVAEQAARFE